MKKLLFLFLLTLLPIVASADAVEIDGIYYNLTTGTKTAEVTAKPSGKYAGTVVIPASVTYGSVTYSVTSIGIYAFYNCTSLTSITIPNSVTSIGNWAFCNCSGLTSITIPEGVKSIEIYVFAGCSSLTSVTIPNSVTSIGSSAFERCTRLASITIPNSLTSIGSSAFERCTGLTSITIPNSVTSIGDYAFRECTGLTSITIPNSVTSIEDGAFLGDHTAEEGGIFLWMHLVLVDDTERGFFALTDGIDLMSAQRTVEIQFSVGIDIADASCL